MSDLSLKLPLGPYTLPDGREFYGMDELELRCFCREAARLQRIADLSLELKLLALPDRPCPVGINDLEKPRVFPRPPIKQLDLI